MAKKYNLKVEQIYIVSLNSVQEFDLEEFKRFLENTQTSSEIKQKTQNESKKIQKKSVLPIQQIDTLFNDENAQNADMNLQEKLGQKILNQIQENNKSKDQNLSGFELRFDPN